MISKKEYIEYLLSTPYNYTCTNMAEHKSNVSHDVVSDFLRQERFTPGQLWSVVSPYLNDSDASVIIADDSVQDNRYSQFIELVKRQYPGNEHGIVKGIGLVNFVHSAGNDGDFWPIDYRIYHPETDRKTKNDHFKEMFMRLITHKQLKCRTILFDSWYGSVDNIKLIHRNGWTFFTRPKSSGRATPRKVSINRDIGYQHLDELVFDEKSLVKGLIVKLKQVPFMVKLFRIDAPNGNTEWIITNDLDHSINLFVAEIKNDNRWQIEEFHRGFKQLTGSEKCQCRKARSQRNHLACCYHAWVSLKIMAVRLGKTIYQLRKELYADYLVHQLRNPTIPAIL